jgi:hypothetical protein
MHCVVLIRCCFFVSSPGRYHHFLPRSIQRIRGASTRTARQRLSTQTQIPQGRSSGPETVVTSFSLEKQLYISLFPMNTKEKREIKASNSDDQVGNSKSPLECCNWKKERQRRRQEKL